MEREPLFIGVKEEGGELRVIVPGGVVFKLKKGFWMAMVKIFENADLAEYDTQYSEVEFRRTINTIKKGLKDWKDEAK